MKDSGDNGLVLIGRITGLYGVHGWVKVHSHTQPADNILRYTPWYLCTEGEWQARVLVEGRSHGKGIVVQLEDCVDRDQARKLLGMDIAVRRSQFPETGGNEYYWVDLIGLEVINLDGAVLGSVDRLMATGANDVLVVRGAQEHLIPFVQGPIVLNVDLERRIIEVDWTVEQ